VSLFVTSQLAAFAFAAGSQAVLFLIYLVAYLCILTYAPANSIDQDILVANYVIGIFSPSPNLLRGLLLSLNEFSSACEGFALASSPGNIKVYGNLFSRGKLAIQH
jgi:ATP-binding cassette subfamily A (ABC1) protein 3